MWSNMHVNELPEREDKVSVLLIVVIRRIEGHSEAFHSQHSSRPALGLILTRKTKMLDNN